MYYPYLAFPLLLGAALLAHATPETLALPQDWYPESVASGLDGSLYVGSWRQGAISRLVPGTSKPQTLVAPGSNGLANTQGILVDSRRQSLWACSGDYGFTTVPSTPSALKHYDLRTGAALASYPMPDAGYCNDLAQDAQGRLYVTDSRHPRILRLAPGERALSVWKEDPQLGSEGPLPGLNGIAFDGRGHLVTSLVMAAPYILQLAITRHGEAGEVTRLVAPRVLKNVDAIRSWKPGYLVLFESNAFGQGPYGGQITAARLSEGRLEIKDVVTGLNDPSSGTVIGDRVYFIESKYGLLFQHKDDVAAIPQGVPFDLQSRRLPAGF